MSRHIQLAVLCLLLVGTLLWPATAGASSTPTLTPEPPDTPETTPYPPFPTGSPYPTGYPGPATQTPTPTATGSDVPMTPVVTPTLTITPSAHRLIRLPLILRSTAVIPLPTETPTTSWRRQMLPLIFRT